jgi:hypothetical protein
MPARRTKRQGGGATVTSTATSTTNLGSWTYGISPPMVCSRLLKSLLHCIRKPRNHSLIMKLFSASSLPRHQMVGSIRRIRNDDGGSGGCRSTTITTTTTTAV